MIINTKKILIISHINVGNFGDRLGYHFINSVLPANAYIYHANFEDWNIPDYNWDLIVVGIGNSIFKDTLSDKLLHLIENAKTSIGIFGTQYRYLIDNNKIDQFIDTLDIWFARYKQDIEFYGNNKNNVIYLGDWLIDAFPMAEPTYSEILTIGDEIWENLPLDRTIQHIQQFKKVFSTRLHPILGALTSANEVAYSEQPDSNGKPSGKYESMLLDIFNQTYEEKKFFTFDKTCVIKYKKTIRKNIRNLEETISKII